jgi:hypothetical protein
MITKKVADLTYETSSDVAVILYNLGLGAKRTDLKWVFEGADGFEVLPTFGVVPQFATQSGFPLAEFLPNFSPVRSYLIVILIEDDAPPR